MFKSVPPTSKLHELFECRDKSLFWKVTFNKVKAGDEAGYKTVNGYRAVKINGIGYLTHRLIYQMFYGEMPNEVLIDHINCDRTDSSIENLRVCTRYENVLNKSLNKNNTSGFKNVYWKKPTQKWAVQIRVQGTMKRIGEFEDLELADLVATEARNKFHGKFANHGAKL